MEGKGIERPPNVVALDETPKRAPESKKKLGHQTKFGLQGGVRQRRGRSENCNILHSCPLFSAPLCVETAIAGIF
jgi:hypothetical protein